MPKHHYLTIILTLSMTGIAQGETSLSVVAAKDTFVNAEYPDVNYGNKGAMQVSADIYGERVAILGFDVAEAVEDFNTLYGSGNWSLTSIALQLSTNNGKANDVPNNVIFFDPIKAGAFSVEWMADDTWDEMSLCYANLTDHLSTDDVQLGTYDWTTTAESESTSTYGLGLTNALQDDILGVSGNAFISLSIWAADDTVCYLFNTRSYNTASHYPTLILTAEVVPEPAHTALVCALLGLICAGWRRHRTASPTQRP
ncbi:MAG: PEP-CTERM sorting domain-containing protein [Verrucomicrobiota bacterium JB024]|nr:PEP-CTERM sorting domain-containing protein [Verrucomicrobiota bacterium JB024]